MPRACTVLAAGLATGLAACGVTTPYPADWPGISGQSPACQPPTGEFDNLGDWVLGDERDTRLLASVFFPLKASEPMAFQGEREAVTRVSMTPAGNGGLRVRAWVGAEVLFEVQLGEDDVQCADGTFGFRNDGWLLEGQVGALAWTRSAYSAYLDAQGGLVLEQQDRGTGLVAGIVPMHSKARTWLRFPAWSPDRQPATPPAGVRDRPGQVWQLVPPAGSRKHSSYERAQACLARAQGSLERSTPQATGPQSPLGTGHDLLTGTRDGKLATPGWSYPKHGWVPGTHDLRVEKQHWATPRVTADYLSCLLDEGFRPERRDAHR